MTRRANLRAELLLAAGAVLAGAVAGVIVQAAIELARDRRATRAQLQAAGDQLDQLAADRDRLRGERDDLAARFRWHFARERDQPANRDAEIEQLRARNTVLEEWAERVHAERVQSFRDRERAREQFGRPQPGTLDVDEPEPMGG